MNNSAEHSLYLKKLRRERRAKYAFQVLIMVLFCTIWEAAAVYKIIDPFIFSCPSRIFHTAVAMVSDGSIFLHTGVTLAETIAGFLISTVLGTLIAILLWWNSFLERVLRPYIVILNCLPKTALAPIIIVWVGNNVKAVIFTAVMTSVIVTVISVLSGFMEVDSEKIKMVKTFGGTKKQVLTKVVLPASIPVIISALKVNIGLSLVGVIVGELLVAQAGLGYLIVYGSQIFKMDWVMLSVIILCGLAALMYRGIVILEKKLSML